jgi:hypothetical protein
MRIVWTLLTTSLLIAGVLTLGLTAQASATTGTNTVYIWSGNLYQGNTSGNGLNLRTVGTGSFAIVPGPATPPLGTDSAQFTLGPGPATGRADIWANEFAGTPLRSISSMGYSTYIESSSDQFSSPIYQLPIFATPGGTSQTFTTLSFQPYNQGVTEPAGWSTWNVLAGQWVASNTNLSSQIAGGCQFATPCTLAQILSAFPDAVLGGVDPLTGIGGVGLILGTTTGPSQGAANNWSFGVDGITTVFDFHTGPPPQGYWLTASNGAVSAFGSATPNGSATNLHLNAPVVGMASDPDGGYWLATSDGGVFSFGAPFFGSMSDQDLNEPIAGIASSPDGGGYYLVGADGGVFTFGDAEFQGSEGGTRLNEPVVGIGITDDNHGYYLVAGDGGVFAFGHAQFQGSQGGMHINGPVVGMAVDDATSGYWLVASDGGVFSFNAPFLGSAGGTPLNAPVVAITGTADDLGYRLVADDGGVFSYGTAQFLGSATGSHPGPQVTGAAATG